MIGRPSPPGFRATEGSPERSARLWARAIWTFSVLGAFVLFVAAGLFLVAVVTGFFCDAVNNEWGVGACHQLLMRLLRL